MSESSLGNFGLGGRVEGSRRFQRENTADDWWKLEEGWFRSNKWHAHERRTRPKPSQEVRPLEMRRGESEVKNRENLWLRLYDMARVKSQPADCRDGGISSSSGRSDRGTLNEW